MNIWEYLYAYLIITVNNVVRWVATVEGVVEVAISRPSDSLPQRDVPASCEMIIRTGNTIESNVWTKGLQ